MFRSTADVIDLIGPAIKRGDRGIIQRAELYGHQAVLSGLSRIALERDILETYPHDDLAIEVGHSIAAR
jgi:hypothetical protein